MITPETAQRIGEYYRTRQTTDSPNRLLTAFAVLGALLIGLGIILILAHNWDELSRGVKTAVAFLPLLVGQGLCAYVFFKKNTNDIWRESAATFLFIAIGACISLVSQIYHVAGSMDSFLLSWILLGLPLVYLLRSSAAALLYLLGLLAYVGIAGFGPSPGAAPYHFLLLLLPIVPHYRYLLRSDPRGNFTNAHNYLLPFLLLLILGTVTRESYEWILLAYMSLFGIFCLIGRLPSVDFTENGLDGWTVIGGGGTLALFFVASFPDLWEDVAANTTSASAVFAAPEFWVALILFVGAAAWTYRQWGHQIRHPLSWAFVPFALLFAIGLFVPLIAAILTNLLLLSYGVYFLKMGADRKHLGILNFGLSLITLLVVCRFFDTNLSFVLRGALFILLGAGFFAGNYLILKKRKHHA